MRKIVPLILALFITLPAWAQDTYIDGYLFSEYDILGNAGIAAPSVSGLGKSRIYFDSTSNTLKLSQKYRCIF